MVRRREQKEVKKRKLKVLKVSVMPSSPLLEGNSFFHYFSDACCSLKVISRFGLAELGFCFNSPSSFFSLKSPGFDVIFYGMFYLLLSLCTYFCFFLVSSREKFRAAGSMSAFLLTLLSRSECSLSLLFLREGLSR